MRDTNIVAETQAEIEAIEMEAQYINSIISDNELRADFGNLEYRAGLPRTGNGQDEGTSP